MTDETPAIPELNRRRLLRGGLVAGAGLAVAGLGTFGLTRVAEAVTFDTQFYWAYCNNCASLWYTDNNTAGVCTYAVYKHGSGGHIKSPSFSYELRYNVSGTGGPSYQPGWNWCGKCQCLFFANNATYSACPATDFTGNHTTGGLAYSVLYNDAVSGSSQPNWWWCGQCQGLFYSSDNVGGYCPATQDGAGPHVSGQGSLYDPPIINSLAYDVSYYSTSSP
jgi:hypothetical protein